jgi:hypothetical protein
VVTTGAEQTEAEHNEPEGDERGHREDEMTKFEIRMTKICRNGCVLGEAVGTSWFPGEGAGMAFKRITV